MVVATADAGAHADPPFRDLPVWTAPCGDRLQLVRVRRLPHPLVTDVRFAGLQRPPRVLLVLVGEPVAQGFQCIAQRLGGVLGALVATSQAFPGGDCQVLSEPHERYGPFAIFLVPTAG